MKKSKFTEQQIAFALQQAEGGRRRKNKYLPGLTLRHPTTWEYAVARLFELNGMDLNVIPTVEPDLARRVDLDVCPHCSSPSSPAISLSRFKSS